MSPDPKAFFYESFAAEWDSKMNRDELGKRLRLIFGSPPPSSTGGGLLYLEEVKGRRVLDAGAGTGHFSRVLSDWGARLVSLDVGPALLGEVRRKTSTLPVCGSVLDLPFADSSFDAVLSTEVIEHTVDPRRAVRELARVVAPGGLLILTVPNRLWRPAILAATALGLRPYGGHENFVPYRELGRWIKDAGLALERQQGFNLLPHTVFCGPAFEFLDGWKSLHPCMINIAVRARKKA